MSHSQAGKGSRRRPMQISEREFARRWAMAFGKLKFQPPLKRKKMVVVTVMPGEWKHWPKGMAHG